MNIKTYLILLGSSFALVIMVASTRYILEPKGTLDEKKIGRRGTAAITAAYLALFCVMAFAIVPLVVRLFIVMQQRIGNGKYIFITWFQAHEQAVVYGCWGVMALVICIICFLARDEILKSLR